MSTPLINVTDRLVSDADLDERIDINLNKDKLTFAQIMQDTDNLIANLQLMIAQQTIQIEIYGRLKRRCILRSMTSEKPAPKVRAKRKK